jgi:predicted RNA binding protein with dsRBD fold (UPF0201 family)
MHPSRRGEQTKKHKVTNAIQPMTTNAHVEKTAMVELLILVDTNDARLGLEELARQLKTIYVIEAPTMPKPQLPSIITDTP